MALPPTLPRLLSAFEQERSGEVRPALNVLVLIGTFSVLAALTAGAAGIPIVPWVLLAVPLVLLGRWSRRRKTLFDRFKQNLLPLLAREIDHTLRYNPRGMSKEEFLSSGLFPEPDEFGSQDLFYGVVHGVPVRFAMVRAHKGGRDLLGVSSSSTLLDGLLFVAELNKRIRGVTRVLPYPEDSETRVLLEHPAFDMEFYVQSTDQVEARYLLTPTMIESILEVKGSFRTMHVQFSGNSMVVALSTGYDLFHPDLDAPLDMAQVASLQSRLARVARMVKHFGLTDSLWTKAPAATPV